MNHAVFCVTPSARCNSQDEIPFLSLIIIQTAGSHFSSGIGRILKDRSHLRGELALGMYALALPAPLVGEEFGVCPAASRTGNDAIREGQRNHVREAVVGVREVPNRLL